MAKKKKTSKQEQVESRGYEITGVVLILLGVLILIALLLPVESVFKSAIADGFLRGVFGVGAYAIPLLLGFAGVMMILHRRHTIHAGKLTMTILLALSLTGLVHVLFSFFVSVGLDAPSFGASIVEAYEAGIAHHGMGAFAALYAFPLSLLVTSYGAIAVFAALVLISLIVLRKLSLRPGMEKVEQAVKSTGEKVQTKINRAMLRRRAKRNRNYDFQLGDDDESVNEPETSAEDTEPPFEPILQGDEIALKYRPRNRKVSVKQYNDQPEEPEEETEAELEETPQNYVAPPLALLNAPVPSRRAGAQDHSEKIEMMESTLRSFGIEAWVENITIGPAITRYELSIAKGTRVSKILNLADDIALSMAAVGVRIEAPIPGKSAIGIEIPNDTVSMVTLREVLEDEAFQKHKSPVAVGLGKDITGRAIVADLSKMPHLLIAGQTGSGKSVCINSIITSLLYKSSPKDVRLILVDPKMVELNVYNGIPHLLTPVVTDPKKAAGALQFVVREMEKRYETFARRKVKDIYRYNEVALAGGEEPMPRIVVIVDELNDLMLVARGEVEDSVMRIAQLARAAGIYLILATQRPSVNVITGVIKANIPSRIAFAVASGIDSKTILDSTGAEKLVGKGDMLFHQSGDQKPIRVQGAFVGEQEIEKVVEAIKAKNLEAKYIAEEQLIMRELKPTHGGSGENPNDGEGGEGEDELFPAAVEYAIECGNVSISALQRRFKVGYARAGRLIDDMELRGIVEPSQGAKARRVLVTREQFWAMYDERLD